MEKLSREDLEKEIQLQRITSMDWKNVKKICDAALSLMDENDKLQGRVIEAHDEGVDDGMQAVMDKVEKLRKELEDRQYAKSKMEGSTMIYIHEVLQDLASIRGEKEVNNEEGTSNKSENSK